MADRMTNFLELQLANFILALILKIIILLEINSQNFLYTMNYSWLFVVVYLDTFTTPPPFFNIQPP